MSASSLVAVENLSIAISSDGRASRVVTGFDLSVASGETVCLVGESGCGKSLTAMALVGLLPPAAAIVAGRILFQGEDLVAAGERRLRQIRGARIGMVFQEPMTSLNPTMTVGDQIAEVLAIHTPMSATERRLAAVALLDRVRIPRAAARIDDYPYMFSGGMRQRVNIALAVACRPALLGADEPTTALDVTVQAEILDLLDELQAEMGMAILLITHDLGVVAEVADRVAVMYAGRIVERATVDALFERPEHPYTFGLLGVLPDTRAPGRLVPIPGRVPSPEAFPDGCRFEPRCPFARQDCRAADPPLHELPGGTFVACLRAPLEVPQ